ncbi:MAG TPA: C25 family cysteine peptidase [Phycisphaerae bacterium]|nr:C25 family cysteine peptidase [Phycisphaerae bacterium]
MKTRFIAVLLGICLSGAPAGGDGPRAQRAGMLIVVPRAMAGALDRFIEHKRKSLDARLVALEEVLAHHAGADDAERLKRHLYDAWRERGVRYVLLVGDADVMPVRYMVLDRVTEPAFDYAFYPSDLYYADVARADGSFDDWNAQREGFHAGYYGEVRGEKNKRDPINYDQVDYRPELALGRWPVSTPEEAAIVAAKTIRYETGLGPARGRETPTAALVAVGGWIDSRGHMDRVAARLEARWRVERLYHADAGRNDGTPPPTEPELLRVMNGGARLVLHAGHGHDDGWEHCLSVGSLGGLRNEESLPVIFSVGCSTARLATLPPYEAYVDANGVEHAGTNSGQVFTVPPPAPACYQKGRFNPTGLGEQMLRAGTVGVVAYIGCNTGSQPCALTLLEGFVESAGRRERPRVGDCWADAVAYYFERERLATIAPTESWYPASIFFQGMKFMLFGDPSLALAGSGEAGEGGAASQPASERPAR